MPQILMPATTMRSPTAVPGKSDMRDENLYSSLVVAHGGSAQQKIFNVPAGGQIPVMAGPAIAPVQIHHRNYGDLTTNLTQAGQIGTGLGDCSFRAIGITIEPTPYPVAGGAGGVTALGQYGAGITEMAEIVNKTVFELKVGGKTQTKSPVFNYPSVGGLYGSFASTTPATQAGIVQNGSGLGPRKLKIPILAGRTDVLEGIFSLGNGSAYVFSVNTGAGQETLIWCTLLTILKGDVR